MTKVIELRPDKNLINQNFEKYQYSSDSVIVDLEKNLPKDAYRREAGNTQESWLEARIFAFHNHLFKNPFDSSSWFVDEDFHIWKLTTNGELALRHGPSIKDTNCLYNPSISFAAKEVTVFTNGGNDLEVLIENSATKRDKHFKINDLGPGVLLDSRYIREESLLVVALCRIEEFNGKKCSKLVVSSYELENKETEEDLLKLRRKQILRIKGPVEYAYIEENGNSIHAISQDTATFEYDSAKSLEEKSEENSGNDEERKIPKYCWSQDEDSLTVWIKLAEKHENDRLEIDSTATKISVSVRNDVLIEGDFQHRLESDLTTWTRDKNTITLELTKHETGLMWSELIKGDTGGECLPNESLAAEIHSRLSHLCTDKVESGSGEGQPLIGFNADQLEECDLAGSDNYLQRIDLNDRKTTHLVILGSSNHVLFTQKLKSGQQICLRHDHHGCVWIPEGNSEEWDIRHIDTFPGFGYVEASKTNKKFCVAPPNGSYVAIVEHTRHAFLYEKAEGTIAKQRIVDIGCDSLPIMGATATDKHLTLLTKNKLYRLVIYP